MWREVTTYQEFALDKNGNYANNKTFFIPSNNLFLYKCPQLGTGFLRLAAGCYQDERQCNGHTDSASIASSHPRSHGRAAGCGRALIETILTARANATADIAAAEAAVDALVAAICGLTPTKATHPAHPTAGA